MDKTNLNESTLEQMLKAMVKTNTGAIPDSMVYWSQAIGKNDPWDKVYVNTWEIEVNFND